MYLNNISNERAAETSDFLIKDSAKNSPHNIWLTAQRREIFSNINPFLEKVALSAGDYIHQPDDAVDYIYFPQTAVISEFQILKDGRAVGLSLHGNESILGLLSIFNSCPADMWTQVLLSGSAYKIKAEIFKTQVLQYQTLQKLMFEYVNSYTKQLMQRVVCNSYHTLEERFCSFLLMLQHYRKNCNLSITQEQIAYFLGTHRPSVTQIAQTLRTKKVINYVRRNLMILDRAGLNSLACDCNAENQILAEND